MGWIEEIASAHFMACSVLVATVLFFLLTRWRRKLPFPPGPPRLPIIGNMLEINQFTHRRLAEIATRYGGLLYLRLGFLNTFIVSTPEIAREVLQAQDAAFANRPASAATAYLSYDRADMAFANYGPFWRQMRKLCVMKLFSKKRTESWVSVREEVDAVVHGLAARSAGGAAVAVNLGELVFNLTMDITYRAAFGSRNDDGQAEFIAIMQEFSKLFGAFNVADFVPWLAWADLQGINRRLKAARLTLDRFIDRIIDHHIANPKEADSPDADMVDEMIAYLEDAGGRRRGRSVVDDSFKLTRNHIKAIVMDVMFGGTETVASAIEWAISELMRSPDDMRRLQEELAAVVGLDRKVVESDLEKLPFLKYTVKETLRLHPPIPLLQHETAEDCEVAGYSVPARSRILINVWAIGRDASAWKGADEFRPARFAPGGEAADLDFKGSCFEFLPFGSGRRSCPGMQLGLYALELAVAQLMHCFTWELPEAMKPSDLDMGDMFGLTAPKAVRLTAVPVQRVTCTL